MTGGAATRNRAEALAQLQAADLDVLVIGGGVVGAGVAWPLARAGLRVALVDARDLAAATSSASSEAHPRRPALPRDARCAAGA